MATLGTINGDGISRVMVVGGLGVNNNDIVCVISDASQLDTFTCMITAGAADISVSLDGVNFSGPLSLQDLAAASTTPVLVMAANRIYGFAGPFAVVRMLQVDGTPAADCALFGKRTAH